MGYFGPIFFTALRFKLPILFPIMGFLGPKDYNLLQPTVNTVQPASHRSLQMEHLVRVRQLSVLAQKIPY